MVVVTCKYGVKNRVKVAWQKSKRLIGVRQNADSSQLTSMESNVKYGNAEDRKCCWIEQITRLTI